MSRENNKGLILAAAVVAAGVAGTAAFGFLHREEPYTGPLWEAAEELVLPEVTQDSADAS